MVTCKLKLLFTLLEHQMLRYFYQELPNIEYQFLLTFNMKPFAIDTYIGSDEDIMQLVTSNGLSWKMRLDPYQKLSMFMSLISDSIITFPTLANPLPLNEVVNVKLYQVYDTFHQEYMIEVRVNGTLIFSKESNKQIPKEYLNVKVLPTYLVTDIRSVTMSNFFVISIP